MKPEICPLDVVSAVLAFSLLLLSIGSAASVFYLRLRTARSRRRRRLLGLSTLWPARLLLAFFASLWAIAELLPLLFLRFLPSGTPAPFPPLTICRFHAILSHSVAEPCFFATLLFLLRASLSKPNLVGTSAAAAFSAALTTALPAAFPFLALQALYLVLAPQILPLIHLPPDLLGATATVVGPRAGGGGRARCAYPIFGTVLLAALAAVYVPLFVSACWAAVSLVINKRLRLRLYVLAAAVVAAMLLQVVALAISNLWAPGRSVYRGLSVAASIAVLICAAAGEGILVVQPVIDALEICEPLPQQMKIFVNDGSLLVGLAGAGEGEADPS